MGSRAGGQNGERRIDVGEDGREVLIATVKAASGKPWPPKPEADFSVNDLTL